MRPELQEISDTYTRIQQYIIPDNTAFRTFIHEDQQQWKENQEQALEVYHRAIEKVRQIVPLLSPEEIISAYREGSTLLQMNVSGHIGRDFTEEYVPVMIEALRSKHVHTSRIFLFVLARNLKKESIPIIIEMIDSPEPFIRLEAIIHAADQHLVEAVPYIQRHTTDEIEEVAVYAKKALQQLSKDTHD